MNIKKHSQLQSNNTKTNKMTHKNKLVSIESELESNIENEEDGVKCNVKVLPITLSNNSRNEKRNKPIITQCNKGSENSFVEDNGTFELVLNKSYHYQCLRNGIQQNQLVTMRNNSHRNYNAHTNDSTTLIKGHCRYNTIDHMPDTNEDKVKVNLINYHLRHSQTNDSYLIRSNINRKVIPIDLCIANRFEIQRKTKPILLETEHNQIELYCKAMISQSNTDRVDQNEERTDMGIEKDIAKEQVIDNEIAGNANTKQDDDIRLSQYANSHSNDNEGKEPSLINENSKRILNKEIKAVQKVLNQKDDLENLQGKALRQANNQKGILNNRRFNVNANRNEYQVNCKDNSNNELKNSQHILKPKEDIYTQLLPKCESNKESTNQPNTPQLKEDSKDHQQPEYEINKATTNQLNHSRINESLNDYISNSNPNEKKFVQLDKVNKPTQAIPLIQHNNNNNPKHNEDSFSNVTKKSTVFSINDSLKNFNMHNDKISSLKHNNKLNNKYKGVNSIITNKENKMIIDELEPKKHVNDDNIYNAETIMNKKDIIIKDKLNEILLNSPRNAISSNLIQSKINATREELSNTILKDSANPQNTHQRNISLNINNNLMKYKSFNNENLAISETREYNSPSHSYKLINQTNANTNVNSNNNPAPLNQQKHFKTLSEMNNGDFINQKSRNIHIRNNNLFHNHTLTLKATPFFPSSYVTGNANNQLIQINNNNDKQNYLAKETGKAKKFKHNNTYYPITRYYYINKQKQAFDKLYKNYTTLIYPPNMFGETGLNNDKPELSFK